MEQVTTVEDDDVRAFAAIFLFDEDVTVAETAAGFEADKDCAFLLFHAFLVEVEVIGVEDLVAAVVDGYLWG